MPTLAQGKVEGGLVVDDFAQNGVIAVHKIPGENNPADLLTKSTGNSNNYAALRNVLVQD